MVTNKSDFTDVFNSYFVNIALNLKEPIIPSDFEILNEYVKSKILINTEFPITTTNEAYVNNFLSTF